ncbi:MAG: hypothetical protein HYW78_01700 [Parcubacteria group bacterium]|nr:hypothetical protein [Parcubacteria group bacterium]
MFLILFSVSSISRYTIIANNVAPDNALIVISIVTIIFVSPVNVLPNNPENVAVSIKVIPTKNNILFIFLLVPP